MKEYCDKTRIDELIANTLNNMKSLVNMETVIGNAIDMGNNCFAYPIIKISVGIVSGGGEYSNKIIIKKGQLYPFAGGSGAGFTAEPIGFLISRPEGCEMVSMQVKNKVSDVMEKLSDIMVDYIKKVMEKENKND